MCISGGISTVIPERLIVSDRMLKKSIHGLFNYVLAEWNPARQIARLFNPRNRAIHPWIAGAPTRRVGQGVFQHPANQPLIFCIIYFHDKGFGA